MTKLEILQDTINHYKLSNRAEQDYGCVYMNSKGLKCAVGRYMIKEDPSEYNSHGNVYSLVARLVESNKPGGLDSLLIEEVRGHDIEFWARLQRLHDQPSNWDVDGLSPDGAEIAGKFLEEYKTNTTH